MIVLYIGEYMRLNRFVCALAIFILSSHIMADTHKESDVELAINAAKDAYTAVEKAGFAWRDTKKFIKQAEKLKKKRPIRAMKLAVIAKKQADLGLLQAKAAKSAGPRF